MPGARQQQRHAGAAHHGHAQPAAGAKLFGGEKRLKHPGERAHVHADAVVADGDLHIVARLGFDVGGGGGVQGFAGGFNAQLAAIRHGVAGVQRQVEQGVFQLVRVGHHHQIVFVGKRGDGDGLRQRAAHQLGHAANQAVDLHRLRLQRLLAREGQQPLDQLDAALRRLHGRVEVIAHFAALAQLLAQRLQIAGDHGEHIVEVVRQAAGELADGFHFLRLHQRGLGAALFGDVKRVNKTAQRHAVGVDFRHQGAARVDGAAVAQVHGIFVSDLLAGQGDADVLFDGGEHLGANNGVDGLAHHVFRLPAKPARVAAIGVLVGPAVVKIGNVRRNGVGDQPQPRLAALERTGDFGIGGHGLGQPGVGGFQLVGACAHMAFQLGVLPLHQLAIEFLFGDVGVQGDKALMRQGRAAYGQHPAVGAGALGVVGAKAARGVHALGHLCVDVARPVFAALGVVADKRLKRHAGHRQRFGKIQQAQKRPVPRHHAQLVVEHGQAGVEQIQPGLHHLAKQPVGFWSGVSVHCHPHDR